MEGDDVVVPVALKDFHLLPEQDLVVLADDHRHTVRVIGILVLLPVFSVSTVDIDVAVPGNDPLINGIQFCAGMYEIFLHGKAFGPSGSIL